MFNPPTGEIFAFNPTSLSTFGKWDGTSWTTVAVSSYPAARANASVAYDASRGKAVIFGGGPSPGYDSAWEFDGTSWAQIIFGSQPPNLSEPFATFDDALQRLVIAGIDDFSGQVTCFSINTTPTGNSWSNIPLGSLDRVSTFSGLANDPGRSEIAAISSNLVTYELDSSGWTEVGQPTVSRRMAMAFAEGLGVGIAFGGDVSGSASDRFYVWESQTDRWSERPFVSRPSARENAAMATDPLTGGIVLFGGSDNSNTLGDTWIWDGSTWSQSQAAAPPGRRNGAMTYVAANGFSYLYGGDDNGTPIHDFWQWDGSAWQALPSGPMLNGPKMALCRNASHLMLVGYNLTSQSLQYWIWDGSWSQVTGTLPPKAGPIVGDPISGRCLMITSGASTFSAAVTWDWDGYGWHQLNTSPSPVLGSFNPFGAGIMATSDGEIITLGGNNVSASSSSSAASRITRIFDWSNTGYASTFGMGCGGQSGAIQLQPAPLTSTAPGSVFSFTAATSEIGAIAIAFLSFNSSAWLGLPLPIDLAPVGMPGCLAYVSPDASFTMLPQPLGTHTGSIPLPATLPSIRFYLQAVCTDSTMPGLLTTSSALQVQVGN